MEITKEIRNIIYREVLDLYLETIKTNFIGFCWIFTEVLEKYFDIFSEKQRNFYEDINQKMFLEIYEHKPKSFFNYSGNTTCKDAYWFLRTDTEIRIKILKEAIELTN